MNYSSKKITVLADAGVGVLVARAALPVVLTWLANLAMRKIAGVHGKIQRVEVHFASPSLLLRGLSLTKANERKIEQSLNISSLLVGTRWNTILTGALV